MPNFMPSENSDGPCFSYTLKTGDICASVMTEYYPLSEDDLMEFNQYTWGRYGCASGHPWVGDKICLSAGTPPIPTPNPEAQCGPLAPPSFQYYLSIKCML